MIGRMMFGAVIWLVYVAAFFIAIVGMEAMIP